MDKVFSRPSQPNISRVFPAQAQPLVIEGALLRSWHWTVAGKLLRKRKKGLIWQCFLGQLFAFYKKSEGILKNSLTHKILKTTFTYISYHNQKAKSTL
jgi:hypothetical protein